MKIEYELCIHETETFQRESSALYGHSCANNRPFYGPVTPMNGQATFASGIMVIVTCVGITDWVCVCVCVCACIYIYIYIYVCVYIDIYIYIIYPYANEARIYFYELIFLLTMKIIYFLPILLYACV